MSARDELVEIVTRDPQSSGGDSVWATDLVDALVREAFAAGRASAGADGFKLDGFRAVFSRSDGSDRPVNELRCTCGRLVQRPGDASLLDLVILAARHECKPGDDSTDRRSALLNEIRKDPSGRWKSGRAVTVLRSRGFHPVSMSTASRDLAALAAAGHLVMREEPGVRWYEPKAGGRS